MNYHRLVLSLLIMGFLSSLFGCRDRAETEPAQSSNSASAPEPTVYEQADIYRNLRDQILKLQPEAIGLASDSTEPLAIMMETGYPEVVATVVCVADGSASLYLSNGVGIIGGGEHEAVNILSRSFIDMCQEFRDSFRPTSEFPLPSEGSVRFYMVTPAGVFASELIIEDELGNMRDTLSPLFHKGHEVITAIREHTPE